MATISKFYLHDAATPNTGTMPTGAFVNGADTAGDATGARTARATSDVIGSLQKSSVITANPISGSGQAWGHRRFVSAPLAARTFASTDLNWTFSWAAAESNTNHNGLINCGIYLWRPSTGLRVGTLFINLFANITATATTAYSSTGTWSTGSQAILDGDLLVFEVSDQFTQSMATAYTSTFFYDGTTEASTTSNAAFVTPPAPLTLFGGAAAAETPQPRVISQAVQRAATRCWARRPSGIVVPRLWTPEAA